METVILVILAVGVLLLRLVLGRFALRAGRTGKGASVMGAIVLAAGVVLLVHTATDETPRGAPAWIAGVLLVLVGIGMFVLGRRRGRSGVPG